MEDQQPKWKAKEESMFIDLVARHPQLWDSSHPLFKRRNLKSNVMKEITEELGKVWPDRAALFTERKLTEKFKICRGYFYREHRKAAEKRNSSGTEAGSQWIHYQRLKFLTKNCLRNASMHAVFMNSIQNNPASDEDDINISESSETINRISSGSINDHAHTSQNLATPLMTMNSGAGRCCVSINDSLLHSRVIRYSDEKSSKDQRTLFSEKTAPDNKVLNFSCSEDNLFGSMVASSLKACPDGSDKEDAKLSIMKVIKCLKYGSKDDLHEILKIIKDDIS